MDFTFNFEVFNDDGSVTVENVGAVVVQSDEHLEALLAPFGNDDELTPATASAYIAANAGEPVTILSAVPAEINGFPIVVVSFTTASGYSFNADVWVEGGSLYGEW